MIKSAVFFTKIFINYLLIVFLIGCSSDNLEDNLEDIKSLLDFYVWSDQEFLEEERVQIDSAIHEWNDTLNKAAEIHIIDWSFEFKNIKDYSLNKKSDFAIIKLHSSHPSLTKQEAASLAFVNTKYGNYNITVFYDRVSILELRGIIIHEMGHCLGAGHNDHGTMNPIFNIDQTRCVDYWTVKQVERYLNIKPGIMVPCP